MKSLFLIITLSFSAVCFAQEKSEARLVDQFAPLPCDDFWARQDRFFVEIQNSPGSVGYAVIYGKPSEPQKILNIEHRLNGIENFRQFYKERFVVVKGKETEEPRIEFWLVPAGADKPDFGETKWDFAFSADQKPFIFHSPDMICPHVGVMRDYSTYLTANPKARANIVIYDTSKAEFNKQRKEFLNELTTEYKISPRRIRFFFVRAAYGSYELWLLP